MKLLHEEQMAQRDLKRLKIIRQTHWTLLTDQEQAFLVENIEHYAKTGRWLKNRAPETIYRLVEFDIPTRLTKQFKICANTKGFSLSLVEQAVRVYICMETKTDCIMSSDPDHNRKVLEFVDAFRAGGENRPVKLSELLA